MPLSQRPLHYGSQILSLAYGRRGISRAEAAKELGLDKATVTRVVKDLVTRGYLREGIPKKETAVGDEISGTEGRPGRPQGRRRVPLGVPDTCGCVLGLEVQGESIKVGLVLPSGSVIHTRTHERGSDISSGDMADSASSLLEDMVLAAEAGRAEARAQGLPVLGVGAALTGLVDAAAGSLLFSKGLGITAGPVPLRLPLEQRLGLPVVLDNDAKCCCYDALTFSEPPAERDFLYLFCDIPKGHPDGYPRLGTALVIDGRVQYGGHFAAGEFRSVFADPAVSGQFGRRSPYFYHHGKSHPLHRSLFVRDLARNVGFIANFLDLKEVRIGGGIEAYKDELTGAMEAALSSLWLYRDELPRSIPLRFADTEEKPAVRGAAAIVMGRIFLGAYHPSPGPVGLEYLDALGHGEGQHRIDGRSPGKGHH